MAEKETLLQIAFIAAHVWKLFLYLYITNHCRSQYHFIPLNCDLRVNQLLMMRNGISSPKKLQ